ncbi:MAG: hypothetical protein V1793_03595 [Pseudomonadota bacterium]
MAQNPVPGITWEAIVKFLLGRIEIPSREEIEMINKRLDRLEKQLFQKKPRSRKSSTGESAVPERKRKRTASDAVLEVINSHADGADFKTIQAETGFDEKKLRNIIFRLDKLKRIVREKRGIYKRA